MNIGVDNGSRLVVTRVSATRAAVTQLVGLAYDVLVESGAEEASSFPEEAYADVGYASTIVARHGTASAKIDILRPQSKAAPAAEGRRQLGCRHCGVAGSDVLRGVGGIRATLT